MKKERDKRATVQRRVARGDESPSDVAKLYPKGTPTDESGLPERGVDLDEKRVREIGAVDAKSARVMKQSRLTIARKAKGDWCKWNDDDDAVRFWECANVWNGCMIEVTQIAPTKDESIPDMPMAMFEGDYGLFKRRIRETYWKGHAATYYWKCYDRTHPQLACGQIEFSRSDDDMNHNRPPPGGGGYPYPPQNPFGPQNPYGGMYGGGMPPNPYGMPFGGAPFPQQQQYPGQVGAAFEQPQPQQVPQQPQYQPPQPAAPVPPVAQGTDANLVQMLMYLSAQLSQTQQQNAYLQQQILQMQAQQQAPAVHPTAQGGDEKKEQQSPVAALKETLSNAKEVMTAGKTFAKEFFPESEEPETETKPPEEPFPVQIKEVGGVNLIAEHGEVVREFWPNAFVNSKGAVAMGMTFFDKIAGIVKSATETNAAPKKEKDKEHDAALERAREMAEIDRQRAESFERAAKARREMEEMNARGNNGGAQQQVVVEVARPAPPPPAPEPAPEPFPIPETSPDQPTPPPNGSVNT